MANHIIKRETYEALLKLKDLKDRYNESLKQEYDELEQHIISELRDQGWTIHTPSYLLGNTLITLNYFDSYFEEELYIDMEDLKQLKPHKPILKELTEEQRKHYYDPPNPADLVDALNDPVHKEIGISRPAYTSRTNAIKTMGNS